MTPTLEDIRAALKRAEEARQRASDMGHPLALQHAYELVRFYRDMLRDMEAQQGEPKESER